MSNKHVRLASTPRLSTKNGNGVRKRVSSILIHCKPSTSTLPTKNGNAVRKRVSSILVQCKPIRVKQEPLSDENPPEVNSELAAHAKKVSIFFVRCKPVSQTSAAADIVPRPPKPPRVSPRKQAAVHDAGLKRRPSRSKKAATVSAPSMAPAVRIRGRAGVTTIRQRWPPYANCIYSRALNELVQGRIDKRKRGRSVYSFASKSSVASVRLKAPRIEVKKKQKEKPKRGGRETSTKRRG